MASTMSCVFSVTLSLMLLVISTTTGDTSYSKSVDTFTGHFYKEVASTSSNENLIFSGLSANLAMAMVGAGATGETREEIGHALFLTNVQDVSTSIKTVFDHVNRKEEGVTLNLANKVFVKPSSDGKLDSVSSSYRTKLHDVFKAEVQQVDFTASDAAAALINNWVEEQTENKIKNLIDPSALTSFTGAVLVNAIYFKGDWAHKFDAEATKSENFHLADGSTVKVDMMNQKQAFLYRESPELDAKIVLLPYKASDVQMVVILPNKVDGLTELQSKLINGTKQHLLGLDLASVTLKLPKFKAESNHDVKRIYEALGVKRVFTPLAELGGILKEEAGLYVSKAIQKAYIEVNEEGSEAAVATGIVANTRVAIRPLPNVEFTADHPFYFTILKSGTVLFSGHKVK